MTMGMSVLVIPVDEVKGLVDCVRRLRILAHVLLR